MQHIMQPWAICQTFGWKSSLILMPIYTRRLIRRSIRMYDSAASYDSIHQYQTNRRFCRCELEILAE